MTHARTVFLHLTIFFLLAAPARADLDSDLLHFQRVLDEQYSTVGARHPDVAATLHRIAAIHEELRHFREAEEHYQRALGILRGTFGETHAGVAGVLNDAAILSYNLADYRRALERHERALAIRQALDGESGPLVATSLANLGTVHRSRGDLPLAIDYQSQALAMRRALFGETHPVVAASWNNLATAWNGMGESDSAIGAHRRALAIRIATRGESHPDVAASWNNLAAALRESGSLVEALDAAGRALAIWKSALGESHPQIASAENNLGRILLQMGHARDALAPLQRALSLSRRGLGRHVSAAIALHRIAAAHRSLGETGPAQRALEQALDALSDPFPRDTSSPWRPLPITIDVLRDLARLEASMPGDRVDQLRRALRRAESALALLHRMRGELSQAARGIQELRWREIPAEILRIRKALELQGVPLDAEAALRAIEVASAWEFLELVAISRADLSGALPESEAAEERMLEAEGRRLDAAAGEPTADAERVLWEEGRDSFIRRIQSEHPRYAALRYPVPVRLESLRRVLAETEAALAYLIAPEHAYLLVVNRESATLHELSSESALTTDIRLMRESLLRGDPIDTFLSRLAAELIPSATAWVDMAKWIIAPAGIMERVAFEMLPRPDGAPLGEKFLLTYVPSLSIFALMRALAPHERQAGSRLLALGNPLYAATGSRDQEASRAARRYSETIRGSWAPLPGTRVEVQSIARLFPAGQSVTLLGDRAREAELDTQLGQRDLGYVHFACHGALEDGPGREPALVLSLVGNVAPQDGFLTLSEILRHPARTRLTVLSACQSGLSAEYLPRTGVSSLARAFLLGGSDAVIVSLWPVSDEATARLMTAFYRGLKSEGLSPDEALQRARLSLRSLPRYEHPYFWAPFVILGY